VKLALVLLACGAGDDAAFRTAFTALLREPDAAARPGLVEKALAEAGDRPLPALTALVARGPLVPADPAEPRTVAGQVETLERFGTVLSGLTFAADGETHRYAVDVPAGYDAKKPVGLLIDPGHGTGAKEDARGKAGFLEMYRRHADESGHADWLVARTEVLEAIGAEGSRGAKPEDEVVVVFDAFLRDVTTRFAVDLDRVHVTGLSQTGFWAWYLGRARADRFAGIAPMSAVTWQVDGALANLRSLPVYVLHGAKDPICPVAPVRATTAALALLGGTMRYREEPEAAHDYAVWKHLPEALRELGKSPRALHPRRVSKSVASAHDRRAYWLAIDALAAAGDGKASTPPAAGIDGEIEGQTVRLFAEGVTRARIGLASELVDLAKPVEVHWNGARVHAGPVTPSARALLELAGETGDWKRLFVAELAVAAPK
jgi:poly(3-hydroxybutyrate) depolymerase